MALGDSHAGGGTGTGEWAAGAGADWGGGNGIGVGGWNGAGGINPNAGIDWASIIGPMPGTVDFNLPDFGLLAGGGGSAAGGAIVGGGGAPQGTFVGGILDDALFDQAPVSMQQPDLLTDLSQIPASAFSPQPTMPSIAPSFTAIGLNPEWSELEDTDYSTAGVNERDARTVAGVAMAENRGNGGLGMQSVMNAGVNRAANDWGGFGTNPAAQMTAPGQFAAPYGAIDPMTLDMGRHAMAGTLLDLTNGAQSFRADRPSALDDAHRTLEAQGSQSLYGHVFSDYAQAPSIPTPPERPAEFGGSYVGIEGTGGTPTLGFEGGLLADTFDAPAVASAPAAAPGPSWADTIGAYAGAMMDGMRGVGSGIGSALASSWGPTNSIYDRVPEYTEPTGITGPKEFTDRAPSYREQPAPSLDQQMAAARADLAARMEQRTRDVAAGGYSFPFGEQRPSLQAFADSPTALAAAQGVPGPSYAQAAPSPYGFSSLSPAAPAERSISSILSEILGMGTAEAATPGYSGMFSPAVTPGAVPSLGAFGTVVGPYTGSFTGEHAPSSFPTPANVPMPPERPTEFSSDPAPRGSSGRAQPASSIASSVPMPPERPADLTSPPAASSGFGWSDVAKYGLPLAGGLVGGPAGALAGAGLYAAGSWLSGLGGGAGAGGPPVSDPYAYGPQGDYPMPQGTGFGAGQQVAAAAAPAPAPAKRNVIHMPSRNAWLTL